MSQKTKKDVASWKSWIFTTDHKKIGLYYLFTALTFFVVGLTLAFFMKTELLSPGKEFLDAETYNIFFTVHGTVMVLFWMIPVLLGFFGNYLIPLLIGARDMAFPRLNAFSYWMYLASGIILILGLLTPHKIDFGWTAYPPFSLTGNVNTAIYIFGVHLLGISSIAGAVNIVTTVLTLRAPGMTLMRMNLTTWGIFAASLTQLVGVPVLAAAVTLLFFDRYLGTSFFNPVGGGNPVLYQHLFWFYAHPAVYVVALPVFGIVSDIISTFSRKKVFGYTSMVFAIMGITILGFEVWVHHLFVAGTGNLTRVIFMWTTVLIGVPTGVKVFNWLGTMYKGAIDLKTPMLHAMGFIMLFTIGGLTGVAQGLVSVDLHVHDTHWVVAHFHYVLSLSMTLMAFGGLYYWFPKMTGRMYNEKLGQIAFWINLPAAIFAFLPHFIIGLMGVPRRYWAIPAEYSPYMWVGTIAAYFLIFSFLLMIYNLFTSIKNGEKCGDNPWGAKSLEWTLPSPPPFYNFDEIPNIKHGPYEFGVKKK